MLSCHSETVNYCLFEIVFRLWIYFERILKYCPRHSWIEILQYQLYMNSIVTEIYILTQRVCWTPIFTPIENIEYKTGNKMEHKTDFLKVPGRIGSAATNKRNDFLWIILFELRINYIIIYIKYFIFYFIVNLDCILIMYQQIRLMLSNITFEVQNIFVNTMTPILI